MIECIFIGDELCDGRTTNTNQQVISETLFKAGFDIERSTTVSDDEHHLDKVFKEVQSRATCVLTTGGLGPTEDDRTTLVLSKALGVRCERNQSIIQRMNNFFESMDRDMPKENEKQADFPIGSILFENNYGTAQAYVLNHKGCHWIVMPGVPKEMKAILDKHVISYIKNKFSNLQKNREIMRFHCYGVGESTLAEHLRPCYPLPTGLNIAYQTSLASIKIILKNELQTYDSQAYFEKISHMMQKILDPWCFSNDINETYEAYVVKTLIALKKKIAVAESCTGGLVSQMITRIPGASSLLDASMVTYSNESKQHWLGISEKVLNTHGAVSCEVAQLMAEKLLKKSHADIVVSITGIAGPDGGTEKKPVGTIYFGLATPKKTETFKKVFVGDREQIQKRSAYFALSLMLT